MPARSGPSKGKAGGANAGHRPLNVSNKPKHSASANRPTGTGAGAKGSHLRTRQKVNILNMYKGKAAKRVKGKLVGATLVSDSVARNKQARVQADRRWFGNTRLVGQKELERFREEIGARVNDPYSVIIKRKQLPMGLLTDAKTISRMKLLDVEPFEQTFGSKKTRKRPKLQGSSSMEAMLASAQGRREGYAEAGDGNALGEEGDRVEVSHSHYEKGQSKRIWGELYKVIDSSDVIVQVVDCRDPMGTRSKTIERHIRENASHKHLVILLNKCDLVPTWATARWVKELSKEYPTVAFHASLTNSFGKGALINLLRQFSKLHQDKKNISVGFIGYPNVGKSSVINTLRSKKVCNVAPIPGETKVWQYITLMKRIFLIDCPGVVASSNNPDTETNTVLKGVVRIENLQVGAAEDHAIAVVDRVKPQYLQRTYKVESWESGLNFLEKLAIRFGKLHKGGEPDVHTAARILLTDWLRGKLPWFTPPPEKSTDAAQIQRGDGGEAKEADGGDGAEGGDAPQALAEEQEFDEIDVASHLEYDDADAKAGPSWSAAAAADANDAPDPDSDDDGDGFDWDDLVEAAETGGGSAAAYDAAEPLDAAGFHGRRHGFIYTTREGVTAYYKDTPPVVSGGGGSGKNAKSKRQKRRQKQYGR